MNSLAIQRIAWKEFRQQRVFFIALVAIAGLVLFVSLMLSGITGSSSPDSAHWPAMIVGIFAALYAAACGGTLFATEKEERTFLNLQILPLQSRQLMTGKLLVALGLCLAFLLATMLAAWASGSMATVAFERIGWFKAWLMTFGLATFEFFAWSMLFSLLLSRPLVAASLGIVAASTSIQIVVRFVNGMLYEPFELNPYVEAFLPRAILMVMVLGADLCIANRWLHGAPVGGKTGWVRNRALERPSTARRLAHPKSDRVLRRKMFGRFVWQSLRSSWLLMLVYCLCLPLCFPIAFQAGRIEFVAPGLLIVAALAGVFAFSADKTSSGAAFLAHHGERPGLYWLANVCVWIGWIVLVNIVITSSVCFVWSYLAGPFFTTHGAFAAVDSHYQDNELFMGMGAVFSILLTITYLTFGMIFTFAGGHLCSVLIDRRVLAAIAAVAFSIPAGIWFVLMLATETPLCWSVFPLLVALMIAGCLATRWWLANRRSFGRVATATVPILLLWAGLVWGVIQKRTFEIPVVFNDVAEYRETLGKPNQEILNEMRLRFASAIEGHEFPEGLHPSIGNLYPQILEALKDGKTGPLEERIDPYWRNEMGMFVETYPGVVIEWQIERVSQHLVDNELRLQQLDRAIQFAADNVDEIRKNEPAYFGKTFDAQQSEPLLPLKVGDSHTLLEIDFYDAVRRNNSHEAWVRLRSLILFESLHELVYGEDLYRWNKLGLLSQWIMMDGIERADVLDALDLAKNGWLNLVNEARVLERSSLKMSDAIKLGHWESVEKSDIAQLKSTLFALFPWEKARSQRLIDLWTNWRVEQLRAMEASRRNETYVSINHRWKNRTGMEGEPAFSSWVDNTIIPSMTGSEVTWWLKEEGLRGRNNNYYRNYWSNNLEYEAKVELQTLRLAVVAWQFENGSMPDNLNQLVGTILDEIPTIRMVDDDGNKVNQPKFEIMPNQPGQGDRYIVPAEEHRTDLLNTNLRFSRIPNVHDRETVETGEPKQ